MGYQIGYQITLSFISTVSFKVSLSRLTELLVSDLFHAYNILSIIEYVVTVLWFEGSSY